MAVSVKIAENAAEKAQFDEFVETHALGNIHQTRKWGEFQASTASRDAFWPLMAVDGAQVVGTALVIKQRLPGGYCWLYCPRGPLSELSGEVFEALVAEIKALARREKAVFLRIDPAVPASTATPKGFRHAHAHYQPEDTLIVDLDDSMDDILAQMKPKGRYNIRLAEKKGVEVTVSDGGEEDLRAFFNLLMETTSRDGFSGHSIYYYDGMLKTLGFEHARLYLARYEGQVIAGIIVTLFRDTAIYYFGASSNEHRNVMAPYLLQKVAMEHAKGRGMKHYDFLGVAPEGETKHAWAGVTQFKEKYGGRREKYLPAQEIVFKPLVFVGINAVKGLKKLLRR